MAGTKTVGVRTPDALIGKVRTALNAPDLPVSDLVRTALARVAGVNVEDYTPAGPGRPPRHPKST